ncbi:putative nucleic acid-binding, replication factor A [Helianthus annuus]|nr:putative nucleic acid-binding, replication factor A [Helianthus annuus]
MTTLLSKHATSMLVLNGDLIFLHLILLWMTLMMTASLSKARLDKSEHNNGKDENKTTFILEDLRHPQIYVTLWGGYADQILEFEKNHKDEKNVVVVVQFGKYRFCGGNLFVSNLYTVTRVFINTEVKEILDFKKKFLTASTSSGYSGLSSSAMKSTTDEYLSDFSFSTIGALSEISQQKFVIILGTIKSFALEDSWFYNACKSCNKKVLTNTICKDKQDRTEGYDEVTILECQTDRCNKRTVVSVPSFDRIKVLIRVQDCTGIVTLTLFEREVVKLIKVNANQLLDKNIELASDGNFPKELKALLNQRFAFKIAIGSFNIKTKQMATQCLS